MVTGSLTHQRTDSDYLCPAYRTSVSESKCHGEWTSTFVQSRALPRTRRGYLPIFLINNPDGFEVNQNGQLLIHAKDENVFEVLSPPDGWIIEFDPDTGWPVKTTVDKEEAYSQWGGADTSYLNLLYERADVVSINGIRAVSRHHSEGGRGPFNVYACCSPFSHDERIGVRNSLLI